MMCRKFIHTEKFIYGNVLWFNLDDRHMVDYCIIFSTFLCVRKFYNEKERH